MQENNLGNNSEYYQIVNDDIFLNSTIIQNVGSGNQQDINVMLHEHDYIHITEVELENSMDPNVDSQSFQSSIVPLNLPTQPTQSTVDSQSFQSNTVPGNLPTQATAERSRQLPLSEKVLNDLIGPYDTEQSIAARTIPNSTNWPGNYNFIVVVQEPEPNVKNTSYVYSALRDKLYVMKDNCCGINFLASNVPDDAKIRVMGVFSDSEDAGEVVKRCFDHARRDYQKGIHAPDHLIRCECDHVSYERDDVSGRRSLVIPYASPQMGQNYSMYLFKFVCYGSCIGGLNRRPFHVIFTLEQGNRIIGRRSLKVKICASPNRDSQNDDKKMPVVAGGQTVLAKVPEPKGKKRKMEKMGKQNNDQLMEILNFVQRMKRAELKTKSERNSHSKGDGPYTIMVRDRETFEFIMHARVLYTLKKSLQQYSPYIQAYLSGLEKQKQKKRKKDDENK